MGRIVFVRENRSCEALPGENLLSVMQREGIAADAACGGRGTCGKCRVSVEGRGKVLACRTIVEENEVLKVDTSDSSQPADGMQILQDSSDTGRPVDEQGRRQPQLRMLRIELPPCPAGKSISDWTRLAACVKEQMPACDLRPDPDIASMIGTKAKEAGRILYVLLFEDRILHLDSKPFPFYMAAFDIGTTTVAAYLLRGEDGFEAAEASCVNPQVLYGADVIGRANYTLENAMEPVSSCIRTAVNELLEEMAQQAGIARKDVYLLSFVGNTCMHHLFLGICVDSLVHAPYNPAISEALILKAADYDIHANEKAQMLMLPNIAGFVGADTVGCLVSTLLAEQEEWTLLIDIGTNGEIVLGRRHEMAACSTAAGPAFEGAGISCGMRGCNGAISAVSWEQGHLKIKVIGDGKIKGICGSGLLDLIAVLLENGMMDEYGQLQETDRILLAAPHESASGEEIFLSQKDVRQLQLAKAAIVTGVRLLAKKMNVALSDISKVWLAGAFGSFLSPESACAVGLIPQELKGKITSVGNAAGAGAKEVLVDRTGWEYAKRAASEVSFLELASMKEFNDCFMDELIFPEQE